MSATKAMPRHNVDFGLAPHVRVLLLLGLVQDMSPCLPQRSGAVVSARSARIIPALANTHTAPPMCAHTRICQQRKQCHDTTGISGWRRTFEYCFAGFAESLVALPSHSGVAQWLACWAHNPKVRGSKPRSAKFSRIDRFGGYLSGARAVGAFDGSQLQAYRMFTAVLRLTPAKVATAQSCNRIGSPHAAARGQSRVGPAPCSQLPPWPLPAAAIPDPRLVAGSDRRFGNRGQP